MNLQPSISTLFNDRRLLFANELTTGGHGQLFFGAAGTFTPPPGYIFYRVDFLASTTLTNAKFRTVNSTNSLVYSALDSNFTSVAFPANYTWYAPLTSFSITTGRGIAYMYKTFIPEEIICT